MQQSELAPSKLAVSSRYVARLILRVLALPVFVVMSIGAMLLAMVRLYKS